MVVEDEALIAMSLEDGLSDEGYAIAGPFSACADALAFLQSATPDVAILDAVLSDGPCLELARELQRRGVPFLIYSGAEAFAEHSSELSGVQWIEKPSDTRIVVKAAQRLGQR
jgi:DNA-binding response OmpR family regulator